MTPSGYSDTLQTGLSWAAGLSDCSLATSGNCTQPAHTLTPPAIMNAFGLRLRLRLLPLLRDMQLMASAYNKHVYTDVSAAHQRVQSLRPSVDINFTKIISFTAISFQT